jgi:hypothetical protein
MKTPTPQTDYIVSKCQPPMDAETAFDAMNDHAEYLEVKLTAVTEQRDRLAEAIRLTLMENLDLCDGDICTLKRLKDAIGFDLDSEENDQAHGTAGGGKKTKTH